MLSAHVIEIVTPEKVLLDGLWFGAKKAERAIIFIHGLTGSAFSMQRVVGALVDSSTAVLTFNNRGFEQIAEVWKIIGKKNEYVPAGAGHEVFTDCADDIQGAVNCAKKMGAKEIYLAGHSTGCQKACYWASKKKDTCVKGIILFGPLSDYAGAVAEDKNGRLAKSVAYAKRLVRAGKPHELMAEKFAPWFVCDAQRFLSLYTPESVEEIFSYALPNKNPRLLKSVRVPTLVLLSGADEHADRSAKEIAVWFEQSIQTKHKVVVIPKVSHSFKGGEKKVAQYIRVFMKATRR